MQSSPPACYRASQYVQWAITCTYLIMEETDSSWRLTSDINLADVSGLPNVALAVEPSQQALDPDWTRNLKIQFSPSTQSEWPQKLYSPASRNFNFRIHCRLDSCTFLQAIWIVMKRRFKLWTQRRYQRRETLSLAKIFWIGSGCRYKRWDCQSFTADADSVRIFWQLHTSLPVVNW